MQKAVTQKLQDQQDAAHSLILSHITVAETKQAADGTLILKIATTGNVSSAISTEALRTALVGKNTTTGMSQIIDAGKDASSVNIERTPSWWPIKSFPFSKKYLTINVTNE